ncbi:MAG: tRNA (adenosine(37)-N6)-threonylcarbamoyltransferase complex ATPase subunit type 1 TsaE [Candidatus Delongbacteria bacterium]|nr:tRNA (adenosine(37)-N6)-threonylcarbamoyltransferase complex ATPase subunit type 1 TsaE [Candidatus Delongbacteria bacterium]MCG2760229.1 tRNA (adenosine(37)-N6)-threonylcarbamoyltransferase complex ATPase subunit type 1 TsaE [Candidatus Delongbacteria bacterium]
MKKNEEIFSFESYSEKETEKIAHKFSKQLRDKDIVCFFGDVGTGKTVFTRGLCRGLGYKSYVNSPSYIVMNMYQTKDLTIYHFDLYRITSIEELTEIGYYDFVGDEKSVSIIEWAEMLKGEIPKKRIEILMTALDENSRKIEIKRV